MYFPAHSRLSASAHKLHTLPRHPMSVFARTPESYAAWQQLKRDVALRSDEQQRAHREKKRRELLLLLAGTRTRRDASAPFRVLAPSLTRR
jgi:hypothetical protein